MLKKILFSFAIIGVFVLGAIVASWYYQQRQTPEQNYASGTVLLEKIEQVCKLVTVEGNFAELYDETNIRSFTLYLPLPSTWKFSKKAIIEVRGQVLVGYDLKDLRVTADSNQQRIILSNLPEPEILSIDHELRYQNLSESYFNSFTAEDYTRLNANAKEVLRQKALESRLMQEAEFEGNQLLRIMEFMVESAGWELLIEQGNQPPRPLDSLRLRG